MPGLWARLRRSRRPSHATPATGPSRGPPAIPGGRVVASYRVGPVEYYVFEFERRPLLRLVVREPERPPRERLDALLAGVEEPASEAEEYYLEKHRSGYSSIYPLVIDPNVEEIAYTRRDAPVLVLHKIFPDRWMETSITLTPEEADGIAMSLARKAGRPLSLASPIAEGVTWEGHRVAVTFGREVTKHGSTFVVRKYPAKPVTIAEIVAGRVLSPLAAAYLWMLIEAQQFIIVAGSMGSGKTTLLQGLATLIPPWRRVVTIEDTPELRLPHPGWDSLHTRPSQPGDDALSIDLEDLLKFALRRRADYIIVGEVRGREAKLLAQAAATGHGSMTTFHADSAEAAVARLMMEPISLPPLFLRSIGAIVVIRRIATPDGAVRRRVVEIAEVAGDELRTIFTWIQADDYHEPTSAEDVARSSERLVEAWRRLGMPSASPAAELEARASFLETLVDAERGEVYARIAKFYEARYRPPA